MYQYNFWRFWHFFGETNHLPCAESLRPILSLTNLKTSSAAALGSNSICYTYFFYYQSIETELTRLLILFWAFFDIFWPDKSLTLCGISEANFGLDQLKDLICSCAGIKLYLLPIFPTTTLLKQNWSVLILLFLAFWTFFGWTNHLPCAESLRPILALTNLRTSSAVALGSNSIFY